MHESSQDQKADELPSRMPPHMFYVERKAKLTILKHQKVKQAMNLDKPMQNGVLQ